MFSYSFTPADMRFVLGFCLAAVIVAVAAYAVGFAFAPAFDPTPGF